MPNKMTEREKHMTLVEHLEELRQRLQYAVLGLLIATGLGLFFVDTLLAVLLRPAGGIRLTTLTEQERRRTIPLALLAGLLFATGVVFGYLVILPVSLHWLLAQAGTQFNALITANAYISFVLFFLLIVGGTFETPLVILSLAFLGVVSPQTLRREWRIAYMVIAGIAVFGTPDWSPVTMLLVAIPMALLYEFSLILCRIFVRPAAPQPVRET